VDLDRVHLVAARGAVAGAPTALPSPVEHPSPNEEARVRLAAVLSATITLMLAAVGEAHAHFLPHRRHLSPQAKVRYFERSVRHDRQAIAWLRSRLAPRTLQRVRDLRWHTAALHWHLLLLADARGKLPRPSVCSVWGVYCAQALAVARCESGVNPAAVNGQYLGAWQMGAAERARYGHGPDLVSQARAAWRYFVASGRDWSPWECKP